MCAARRPFTAATLVQFPLGTPQKNQGNQPPRLIPFFVCTFCREGLRKVLVYVFSMANLDNQDDKLGVMNFVDNAVIA